MNQQPEALRLADSLSGTPDCNCAARSSHECACDTAWPEQFITEAAIELRRLHAENEALRKDAERLNYIETHPGKNLRYHKNRWSFVGFTNYEYPVFKTLREAIDQAMKGQS